MAVLVLVQVHVLVQVLSRSMVTCRACSGAGVDSTGVPEREVVTSLTPYSPLILECCGSVTLFSVSTMNTCGIERLLSNQVTVPDTVKASGLHVTKPGTQAPIITHVSLLKPWLHHFDAQGAANHCLLAASMLPYARQQTGSLPVKERAVRNQVISAVAVHCASLPVLQLAQLWQSNATEHCWPGGGTTVGHRHRYSTIIQQTFPVTHATSSMLPCRYWLVCHSLSATSSATAQRLTYRACVRLERHRGSCHRQRTH